MKLQQLYSLATGLSIRQQRLPEFFYPISAARYITLHASSGMAAKNYPYYQECVAMIARILESQDIKIIQLGGKDDALINGCVDLRGKTNYYQSNYILHRSLCHLGNDSWLAHRAGELNIPLITLFGPTSVKNHSAYRYDVTKTIFLESHRWGRNPTFASQEQPLSIALIPPERVANSVLKLLGIGDQFAFQTQYVGGFYTNAMLELVPNTFPPASFLPDLPVTVRMDILFDEANLINILQTGRRIHIITNRPINPNILGQFKGSIQSFSFEIVDDSLTTEYANVIKTLFTNLAFFSRETDEKKLADLRFRFFDCININHQRDFTREDYIDEVLTYLNRSNTPDARLDIVTQLNQAKIKTNKYVLSGGRIYPSYAHLAANKPLESLSNNIVPIIDDPILWRDLHHFLITYEHPQA